MKTNYKKYLTALATVTAVTAPVASVVACGPSDGGEGSDLQFMNYEDYMDEDFQTSIGEVFEYKQFGDLPEIKTGIKNQSIAGAIGSDYFNAALASRGLLAKIQFSRLYGAAAVPGDKGLEDELKALYTPATFQILDSFNLVERNENNEMLDANGQVTDDITKAKPLDVDNDTKQDKLWQFMAPYFSQNKVITVNLARFSNQAALDAAGLKVNGKYVSQADFKIAFDKLLTGKPASYANVFDELKKLGADKLTINDYMRDNMMIGSETADATTFVNTPTKANYEDQIKGMKAIVTKIAPNALWPTSGVDSLTSLMKNGTDSAVATLYNGDALYAHNGGGLEDSEVDNADAVRIIIPANSSFLLDGLVIPKYMDDASHSADLEKLYAKMKETIYNGVTVKADADDFDTTGLWKNFDSVNYTPAFKNLYENVVANYFENDDKSVDEDGKAFLSATAEAAANYTVTGTDVKSFAAHVTGVIANDLENAIYTNYNNMKSN